MPLPDPVPGLVISYAYLWGDQQDQGREEGGKDRPCVVATEMNRFLWPGPDLRPVPGRPDVFAYGSLPRQLMLQLRERIAELHQDRRFRIIYRESDGNEGL